MQHVIRSAAALLALFAFAHTAQAGDICAVLFQHKDYGGANYVVYNEDANASYVGDWWNDKISSVSVMPNCSLTLFEHDYFSGAHVVYRGYVDYVGRWWNDRASSYTCYCD